MPIICTVVYGPNGSGKYSFALAIFDIGNHLSSKLKRTDSYSNFVWAGNPKAPVEFEYVFKFGDDSLEYQYSKNSVEYYFTLNLCPICKVLVCLMPFNWQILLTVVPCRLAILLNVSPDFTL